MGLIEADDTILQRSRVSRVQKIKEAIFLNQVKFEKFCLRPEVMIRNCRFVTQRNNSGLTCRFCKRCVLFDGTGMELGIPTGEYSAKGAFCFRLDAVKQTG